MSMTRAEAIKILERRTTIPGDGYTFELINEALDLALAALRGPTRETVERLFPGCDICHEAPLEKVGLNEEEIYVVDGKEVPANESLRYCPRCGKPLTDEAVDMMLERWKEALNGKAD